MPLYATATQSFSGGGTSITGAGVSVALVGGNNVSLASASGAGSLTLSIHASSNALANVSLLNGSSGALSLSAGAGIGIGQANSTMTFSASVQTSSISLTARGNTTVSSAGTFSNLLNVSGAGIVSVGAGAGSLSISAVEALQSFSGGGASVTGAGISVAIVGGNNISLASASGAGSLTLTVNASSNALANVAAFGTGAATSTGTVVLAAGNNITLNTAASTISIVGAAPSVSRLLVTENFPIGSALNPISKAGTVTGTAGFGSSLFLNRLFVPANMTITEADMILGIAFVNSAQGAGTLSRSLAIYSFGNSTSLATVASVSSSSAWNTGTVTAGASTSLTQFQGGWSANIGTAGANGLIQPMTFNSTALAAGEYVIGQIFDFAQATSTWTVQLFGSAPMRSASFSNVTNQGGDTVQVMSSGGLIAASGLTGISSYASQFLALSTAGSMTAFRISGTLSTAASSISAPIGASATTATVAGISRYNLTLTNTAASASFQLAGESSNSNIISSLGTKAGSIFSASTSLEVISSNTFFLFQSLTYMRPAGLNFSFIGTGPVTTNYPYYFSQGIMSTGAIPAAITLTSAAVTYTGSNASLQPWFALVGS